MGSRQNLQEFDKANPLAGNETSFLRDRLAWALGRRSDLRSAAQRITERTLDSLAIEWGAANSGTPGPTADVARNYLKARIQKGSTEEALAEPGRQLELLRKMSAEAIFADLKRVEAEVETTKTELERAVRMERERERRAAQLNREEATLQALSDELVALSHGSAKGKSPPGRLRLVGSKPGVGPINRRIGVTPRRKKRPISFAASRLRVTRPPFLLRRVVPCTAPVPILKRQASREGAKKSRNPWRLGGLA